MYNAYGFVYCMSNNAIKNQIIAYERDKNGMLHRSHCYDTGGKGTGEEVVDPLASQGSIAISYCDDLLFVVNAGSNSISNFSIADNGELCLLEVVPTGGVLPNAIAISQDIVYVANRGNQQEASTITGFQINACKRLQQIPYACYALGALDIRPSCLVFAPKGNKLVVSLLSTNQILIFPVQRNGTLGQGVLNASSGAGPFGSVFLHDGTLLVSEAADGALSSYNVTPCSNLEVISSSVLNHQKATCWVSVANCEQVAYTSNAGSDTISVYAIHNARLTLRNNVQSDPNTHAAPLDNAVSCDGNNLYVLNGNEGTISVFRIKSNGDITLVQIFSDTHLPRIGAQGLAER